MWLRRLPEVGEGCFNSETLQSVQVLLLKYCSSTAEWICFLFFARLSPLSGIG